MVELTIRLVFSLAVVVGLLLLATRMGSRKFRGGRRASTVSVLHRQALSRTSSVAVVEVGNRVLVLGTTEHQVNLLTEIDPDDLAAGGSVIDLADRRTEPVAEEQHPDTAPDDTQDESVEAPAFGRHLSAALETEAPAPSPVSTRVEVPAVPGRRKAGAHAAKPARTAAPRSRATRTASGPLAGSVLSPETWRQAVAAARRTG